MQLAGKYLVVYIRGAYNQMLFLFTGRWTHILGGGLISWGVGAYNRMYIFVYRCGPISYGESL